jgi:hypothetical protein
MTAAELGCVDILRLLIENGSDLNMQDTVLLLALFNL